MVFVSLTCIVPECPRDFHETATFLEQPGPCPATLRNTLLVDRVPLCPHTNTPVNSPKQKCLLICKFSGNVCQAQTSFLPCPNS